MDIDWEGIGKIAAAIVLILLINLICNSIEKAFTEITGHEPDFIFSGWGAELTEGEREVVEDES